MSQLISADERRSLATRIWRAGVEAIDSRRLMEETVTFDGDSLRIAGKTFPLDSFRDLIVVGAGKAGQGMVSGLEACLPEEFLKTRVRGWVNVPSDCVGESSGSPIVRHAARPAGINEPRPEGVLGTQKIIELIEQADPKDLCLVLLSGGGSALLPAPVDAISLEDKIEVTQRLSRRGASIEELNLVRTCLSQLKGGGLLRHCRGQHVITLIISDVIGDPLETIASGPTVETFRSPTAALVVLRKYLTDEIPPRVEEYLANGRHDCRRNEEPPSVDNIVIGNNCRAISHAAARATELGFRAETCGSDNQGPAAEFGKTLVEQAAQASPGDQPVCFIHGGETTVSLAGVDSPGKGGRNQEVALAAALAMRSHPEFTDRLTILAGGTDGEDGPTDAAGGYADYKVHERATGLGLCLEDHLRRHDAYNLLDRCDSLLRVGPTHTNVMDLTITLVWP
ncbi:glycerate kinase type-2 family protein [Rubinisphaera margarita]|uniref:glycerate kinase type-2 family protein n=1 Tax=Rubinisphaera margarita TaxID=2909586 RepID=UPI001EE877EB|nr:DUF4147 domain-containing protein [Rubinisphaera margarita]MCG6154734.1 DUF4147 domain-containing protein [Rubinisphaera margarita]